MKKLRVTVEGKVYNVLVEMLDEDGSASPPSPSGPVPTALVLPAQPSVSTTPAPSTTSASPASATPAAAGPGDVKSPLAGRVVSIDVQPGQAVAEGTQVLTIEAMKMNTYIYAHQGGRIDAILIAAGDPVEEGQALLKIS